MNWFLKLLKTFYKYKNINVQSTILLSMNMKNRITISIIWLIRSDWSSVWKCYKIEIKIFILNLLKTVFQNSDMNLEFLLLMIILKILHSYEIYTANTISIHLFAFHIVFSEISNIFLINLHIIVNRASKSFIEIGKIIIKSITTMWNDIADWSIKIILS